MRKRLSKLPFSNLSFSFSPKFTVSWQDVLTVTGSHSFQGFSRLSAIKRPWTQLFLNRNCNQRMLLVCARASGAPNRPSSPKPLLRQFVVRITVTVWAAPRINECCSYSTMRDSMKNLWARSWLQFNLHQQDTKEYLNQRGTKIGVFQESKKGGKRGRRSGGRVNRAWRGKRGEKWGEKGGRKRARKSARKTLILVPLWFRYSLVAFQLQFHELSWSSLSFLWFPSFSWKATRMQL